MAKNLLNFFIKLIATVIFTFCYNYLLSNIVQKTLLCSVVLNDPIKILYMIISFCCQVLDFSS